MVSNNTEWATEAADDIDIGEDEAASAPVFVAQCIDAQLVRRNGVAKMHVAWEPLSFKQVFNRAKYDFRKDDYTHDWITTHTKDGRLMGSTSQFGQLKSAFEALGMPIIRNEQFRELIVGRIFKVTRVREEWSPKNPDGSVQMGEDGKPIVRASFYIKPLEVLEEYTPPANLKVQRYGFEASSAPEVVQATPQQQSALKSATNGKAVDDLVNAILDSGNEAILCEPFLSEAGNGALIDRLVVLGARVVSNKVYFAEVGN